MTEEELAAEPWFDADEAFDRAAAPRHAFRPPPSLAHRFWSSPFTRVVLSLVFVAVVMVTASVGVSAWAAKGHLQQAQALVTVVKSQVSAGDYGALPGTFDQIHQHTAKARSLTGGRLWSMAERLPKLGPNLITLRELTAVVDDTMVASEPLVALAPEFTHENLAPNLALSWWGGVRLCR